MSQFSNQGVVSKTSTKEWYDNKKGRNINLYSFQIHGNNRWFRTGTTEPNFREGDAIQFTNDDKNNVQLNSIQVGNAPSAPVQTASQAAAQPQPATVSGGQSRESYWANRELNDKAKDKRYQEEDIPRMTFSAAQDRAVQLVSAALAHDCLSFGNMAKGQKLDFLLGCVDQVTDRFFMNAIHSPERLRSLEEVASSLQAYEESDSDSDGASYE